MQVPKVVAKAVFFIEGDEHAHDYQATVIEYQAQKWLVATWLQSPSTGERFPERIVPLSQFPYVELQNGLLRLGLLVPRGLLLPDAEDALLQRFQAQTYPTVGLVQGPESLH